MIEKGSNRKLTAQETEDWVLLCATAIFLIISIISILSVFLAPNNGQTMLKLVLSGFCVVVAFFCNELSPRNRGRFFKMALEKFSSIEITPKDIMDLQKSVGSAGYFNRIGLVGIPLAVALLAILLMGLFFLAKHLNYLNASSVFLELIKLTIGAFIGALAGAKAKN